MSTQTTTETFAEIGISTNPFPGLRPFEFDESHLFFGRDGQSESLIDKLSRTRFLAVVGTSGSGKSSLVRAGFLPSLYGGFMTSAGSGWRIAIMRPGNDPIGNLARALNAPDVFGSDIDESAAIQTAMAEATLRRGSLGLVDAIRQAVMPENENLLVVVDQFEEIFRFARVAEGETYGNEAAAFVKLLLEASRQREIPIYVVLTMRSDYLGDCSQFWELPEAINESQYLIPRLTRDQLREAITGPVAVGGGEITPRLVNRLLNDVGDNQDQLPVLQHLLMRIWDESKEKRLAIQVDPADPTITRPHQEVHEGEAMDLCCSEAVGGMTEALSRHADEAFNELPDKHHRTVAEKLFKALTEKGPDNRETRRPITLSQICAVTGAGAAIVITVIDTFRQPGRSFLMPPAVVPLSENSLIDISHESLIRGWSRLNKWTEEEAQSARLYRRLADTAMLHETKLEGLLKDPALQVALDWREKTKPNEAWAHRYHPGLATANAFLDQSVAAREAELVETQRQQKRDTSYKRSKILVACLVVASGLLLSMFVYAYGKNVKANAGLAKAIAQQEIADHKRREAEDLGVKAQQKSDAAAMQAAQASMQAAAATKQAADAEAAKKEADREKAEAVGAKEKAEKAEAEAIVLRKTAEEQRDLAKKQANELLAQKAELAYRAEQIKSTNEKLASVVENGSAAARRGEGIDVSRHDGNVNWGNLGNSGISFAFMKATQGTKMVDQSFVTNTKAAQAAGIPAGAYHFFTTDDPKAQAELFLSTVGTNTQLRPVLDVETPYGGPGWGDSLESSMKIWLDLVEAKMGCEPIIITSASFVRNIKSPGFERYPLWLMKYSPTAPVAPPPWTKWTLWQYTDRGHSGTGDGVFVGDHSRLSGSVDDLRCKSKP
jgi:GH25 family lysozyme M1 (1,4-beta-N-acetylmuramidase)